MFLNLFPLWGSIIDDIWAIDNASEGHADVAGPSRLHTATGEWERIGAASHRHKEVDLGEGEEVQSYFVHPTLHWIGVSLKKRRDLLQGLVHILTCSVVLVGEVDRLHGKLGFCCTARAPLRSLFQETYRWLQFHREAKTRVAPLPFAV